MSSPRPSPETIPAPLRRYWREFRIRWLPWIAFVLMGLCVVGMWHEVVLPHAVVGPESDPGPDDPALVPEPDGSDEPTVCIRKQARHSASYTTNLGVGSTRPQD